MIMIQETSIGKLKTAIFFYIINIKITLLKNPIKDKTIACETSNPIETRNPVLEYLKEFSLEDNIPSDIW